MRIHISNFYQSKRNELTKVSLTILAIILCLSLAALLLPTLQANTLRFTGFNPIALNVSFFRVGIITECSELVPQLSELCADLQNQSGSSLTAFRDFLCERRTSVVNTLVDTLTDDDNWTNILSHHVQNLDASSSLSGGGGGGAGGLRQATKSLLFKAVGKAKPQASAITSLDHGCATAALACESVCLSVAMASVYAFAKAPSESKRNGLIAMNIGAAIFLAAGVSLYSTLGDYITRDRLDIFYTHSYSWGFYLLAALAALTFATAIIVSKLLNPVFYSSVQRQLVHYAKHYDHAIVAPALGGGREFDGYIETQGSVVSDTDLIQRNVELDDEIVAAELKNLL